MLTEPFESTKSWPQLTEIVKETHAKITKLSNKRLFSFKISDKIDKNQKLIGLRIYCLGSINDSSENTILYCDINENEHFSIKDNLIKSLNTDAINNDTEEDNLNLFVFEWKELIKAHIFKHDLSKKFKEENVLECRRQVVDYQFHKITKRFVFVSEGLLYYFDDVGTPPYSPIRLESDVFYSKINISICPTNPDLVAYVSEKELYVYNIPLRQEIKLTNSKEDQPDRAIISGLPSYVIQEEFNRYIGFWWQPLNFEKPNHYCILYEEVDETDVELIKLSSWDGSVEEHRYPKTGKKNAYSVLKLAKFNLDVSNNSIVNQNISVLNNINNLKHLLPSYEYLIKCEWVTYDSILVQLLNRNQKNLYLVLISLYNNFSPQILHHETDENCWINIGNSLSFLYKNDLKNKSLKIGSELEFIWASQKNGYRHLYKIKSKIEEFNNTSGQLTKCITMSNIQLTNGNWEVCDENFWVDDIHDLVFFVGLKDSPLEKQLYVTFLNKEFTNNEIKRLTRSGFSNSTIEFNSNRLFFLNIQSSISKPPFGFLNSLSFSKKLPIVNKLGYIMTNKIIKQDGTVINTIEHFELLPGFSRPELFSYQLKESGEIVYGLIYKPDFMQADKKYPVILEIYGGPSVQFITNSFKDIRLMRRHLLASQGYVVCVFDCRGSYNRGRSFECHIHKKFGQVEINDQLEVLNWLSSTTNYIDMNRVAIYGWSFGGYLSLMFFAKRPDIFKVCVAGAPVTNWLLYDTAYTERYLDLPTVNPESYYKGSVINKVNNFPDEENRLLLIHGLMDFNVLHNHTIELIHELVKAGKPYCLEVLPNERHSLSNLYTRLYYITHLLSFFNKNL